MLRDPRDAESQSLLLNVMLDPQRNSSTYYIDSYIMGIHPLSLTSQLCSSYTHLILKHYCS